VPPIATGPLGLTFSVWLVIVGVGATSVMAAVCLLDAETFRPVSSVKVDTTRSRFPSSASRIV
jgi:hypothetical protein